MTIYTLFAFLATALSIIGYIPYIRDLRKGKTKPHIFSWIIWTMMTAIFFFAQVSDGAGIGALTSGVTTILCLYVIAVSLKLSDKSIKPIDYLSFGISLIALAIWYFVKTPVYSVILITLSDMMALVPTVRKSFMKPYSETLSTYSISGLKHFINLFSLERITFVSSFYTIYLVLANIFLVTFLVLRRRVITKPQSHN